MTLKKEISRLFFRKAYGYYSVVLVITYLSLLNIIQIIRIYNLDHRYLHVNYIKSEVILSHPVSYDVYLATSDPSRFFKMEEASFPVFLSLLILVIIGWLSFVYFYQIPSQPTMMNSSSACLFISVISGLQVISCSYQFFPFTFL